MGKFASSVLLRDKTKVGIVVCPPAAVIVPAAATSRNATEYGQVRSRIRSMISMLSSNTCSRPQLLRSNFFCAFLCVAEVKTVDEGVNICGSIAGATTITFRLEEKSSQAPSVVLAEVRREIIVAWRS